MDVYVTASSKRTRANADLYKKVLNVLEEYQFNNVNKYFSDIVDRKVDGQNKHTLYETSLKQLKKSALLIVDVSDQSVTLGVLIEYARSNNIPILILCEDAFRDTVPKIFLYKNNSNQFTLLIYKHDDIDLYLRSYLDNFKKNKIKFNVFLTPEFDNYMNWYAKKHNISKSDLFRDLLIEKLSTDQEYLKENS